MTISSDTNRLLRTVFPNRDGEVWIECGHFAPHLVITERGRIGTSLPDDKAVYYCAGLIKPGGTRRNADIEAVHVLTIDDVGSKIDLDAMLMMAPEPTFKICTSPGNYQWQYAMPRGMDPDTYVALRASMKASPVWGHSEAIAPSNLVRLPMGVNGKPGVVHDVWMLVPTGPTYDPDDVIAAFGGLTVTVQQMKAAAGALRAPSDAAVNAALARLPNDGTSPYCDSYAAWITFGLALYGATGGEGLELWLDWSNQQPQAADPAEKWGTFNDTGIGWDSLLTWEERYGQGSRGALAGALFDDGEPLPVDKPGDKSGVSGGLPDAKQLAYAVALVRMFKDRMRYNLDQGAWAWFDDNVWVTLSPKVKLAFRLSVDFAMIAPPRAKGQADTTVAGFHDGVENLCRQSSTLQARQVDFDTDTYLLGTPEGTVSLRTGALVPARAADMISKSTAVAPSAEVDCPRWLRFIAEITGGDLSSQEYLQMHAGYCLTGDTLEQIFLFLHGPGGNGKSVYADTLMAVMGSYAVKPVGDLFIKKAMGMGHTSKLAMLAGARLCTVSEVPAGAQWDEGLLKDITGGGSMTACFKHKDEFTFVPQFKLLALGNNQPTFPGGINPAIRRRFRMMEFSFVPKVVDKDLMTKLRAEWPGILRWMIDGCVKWQKTRLITPDAVTEATEGFFADQDTFGRWIDARLEKKAGAVGDSNDLFRDWIDWRNAQGEHQLLDNQTTFGREMTERRGFVKARSNTIRGYRDVRLKSKGADVFNS